MDALPFKGRACKIDGAVEVVVRAPLFPLLLGPLMLISVFSESTAFDARVATFVVAVLALFVFVSYLQTAACIREFREDVTGLSSSLNRNTRPS